MMLSSWVTKGSLPSRVGYFSITCATKNSMIARPIAIRTRCCFRASGLEEEFHLHACELDDVMVLERVRRRPDLLAVHVGAVRALDVSDEITLRAAGEHRDLYAGLAERGERLGGLELLAGVCARQEVGRAERLPGGLGRGRHRLGGVLDVGDAGGWGRRRRTVGPPPAPRPP